MIFFVFSSFRVCDSAIGFPLAILGIVVLAENLWLAWHVVFVSFWTAFAVLPSATWLAVRPMYILRARMLLIKAEGQSMGSEMAVVLTRRIIGFGVPLASAFVFTIVVGIDILVGQSPSDPFIWKPEREIIPRICWLGGTAAMLLWTRPKRRPPPQSPHGTELTEVTLTK